MAYVFSHLCLLLDGLLRDVCGSDLLSDSSGLAILNVGVSELHANNENKQQYVNVVSSVTVGKNSVSRE